MIVWCLIRYSFKYDTILERVFYQTDAFGVVQIGALVWFYYANWIFEITMQNFVVGLILYSKGIQFIYVYEYFSGCIFFGLSPFYIVFIASKIRHLAGS